MEDKKVLTQNLTVTVSSAVGNVSAEAMYTDDFKVMIILAHGAGAGMSHPFMTSLSRELIKHNIATIRYNFPFIENKKKRPDFPAVAHQTVSAVVTQSQTLFPKAKLYAAGKSFGGRMTSQWLAVNPNPEIMGIIFYGFPLHAPGKPSIDRAEHLKQIKIPMLFLQGTRDTLANLELITQVTSGLPTATLQILEGADHSFKAGKNNNISNLAELTSQFVVNTI